MRLWLALSTLEPDVPSPLLDTLAPTMRLTSLSLTNFRNYTSQAFEAGPGVVLLLGDNAQGKTNVLEAIFLLATGAPAVRRGAEGDADYIHREARDEDAARSRASLPRGRSAVFIVLEEFL